MANPVTVPRLGWSMEEGVFVEWLKADGEAVRAGDPLFVLEGEKAAETIEALDAGMLRLLPDGPAPGTVVKVGQTLAWVGEVGERIVLPLAAERLPPASERPRESAKPQAAGRTMAITPRARRLAHAFGLDPLAIAGTGRRGRVRERDVQAAAASGRLVAHTRTRRTIAARMVAGVTQAAPVTLTSKIDVTDFVRWRAAQSPRPSVTECVLHAVARALARHPMLQAQWRDDGLWMPQGVHLAVAVDAEAGLLTPVIRDCDSLGLAATVERLRDLVAKARAGKLTAEEMSGATFTVSNLGGLGVDAFTPIITLPQCAVLGVGRIVREPACVGDAIVPRDMMTLSLTFDHRIVDGAPAARFLQDLADLSPRGAL